MIGRMASGAAAGIVEGVGATLDRLFTSDEERAKAEAALRQVADLPILRELDRQIAEAQHPSVFVAGARPAMLWAATAGIAYAYVLQPLLAWGLVVAAWASGGDAPPPPPDLDVIELLMVTLGGGGLYVARGVDKSRGAARENLQPDALTRWRASR